MHISTTLTDAPLPPLTQSEPSPVSALRLRFMRLARVFYMGGLALSLIAVGTTAWMPTPLIKLSFFSVCATMALILFLFSGGGVDIVRSRGRFLVLLSALLPVVYLVSWKLSLDPSTALLGTGNEVDSVLFVMLGFIALVLGWLSIRSTRAAKLFIGVAAGAILLAVFFQYLQIFFGTKLLPASIFSDKTINLIGKWNDLGLLSAIASILLAAYVDIWKPLLYKKISTAILIAVLVLFAAIVNFFLAWWFMFVGAVLSVLFIFISQRRNPQDTPPSSYWFVGILAALSLAGAIWGASISSHLPGFLTVPSIEVRPAYNTTQNIAGSAHGTSALRTLVGTGPNTFGDAWLAYKPLGPSGVNETQFWNVDFITGFSVISTAFVSVGLLGIIAWSIPLLIVLGLLLKAFLSRSIHSYERSMLFLLGITAAGLWIGAATYAFSQNVVLLAFATTGACIGVGASVFRGAPSHHSSRLLSLLSGFVVLILLTAAVWGASSVVRHTVALAYEQRAALALSQQNLDAASSLNTHSQQIERNGINLRLGVSIAVAKLQQLLSTQPTNANGEELRTQFQATLADAINNNAKPAIEKDPQNYLSYLQLANIYELLVPLKVEGALEQNKVAYEAAIEHNPTNPMLPLLYARLLANTDLQKNSADVSKLVAQSLKLKNNYTDALLFTEQLAVAQNDLKTAIAAGGAAISSAGNQPPEVLGPMWFQLGLFYYVGNDVPSAVAALEQAVKLIPNYANAKYFLALGYYREGRTADSMALFSEIQKTNPDNAEIKSILTNLQAGKDPFAGQKPPANNPAARTSAPIKE